MTGKATITLECPQMAIRHVKGRLWRTAEEPMKATIVLPDGSTMTIPKVTIPQTNVHEHLALFPDVATVDACEGYGESDGISLKVNLPEEPVKFEAWHLVAKQMTATATLSLRLPDGVHVATGSVVFPDCLTSLFGGGAQAITATGSVVFP